MVEVISREEESLRVFEKDMVVVEERERNGER